MASVNVISKVVSSAGTPEVLGTTAQRFKGVTFYGGKGSAEDINTGTVYIQLMSMGTNGVSGAFASAIPVPRGGWSVGINLETTGIGVFDASQFYIKVGNDGDGVVAIVAS